MSGRRHPTGGDHVVDQRHVATQRWAVHHAGGAVETVGLHSREHADEVARAVNGTVLGPYTEAEVQRLAELDARPWRRDAHAFTDSERDDFWALLDRRALPGV
jgi:hypothetical protein